LIADALKHMQSSPDKSDEELREMARELVREGMASSVCRVKDPLDPQNDEGIRRSRRRLDCRRQRGRLRRGPGGGPSPQG